MDITFQSGTWHELHEKVTSVRSKSEHESTLEKRSSFTQDENDIHPLTLHIICEIDEQEIASARILSNGEIDEFHFLDKLGEHAKTRFLLRVIREAIVNNPEQELFITNDTRITSFAQSLNLPLKNKTYTLTTDAKTRRDFFDNSVLRLSREHEFLKHLKLMCLFGKRSLDILSSDLEPHRFNADIARAVSRLARHHRNVQIRILVQNTKHLVGKSHPLVNLAQRLSTSVSIRRLQEEPDRPEQAYAIIDKSMLLYYNDEREAKGFANYHAQAESEHFTEAFERMWQYYSEIDPNLVQLHL